MERAKPVQEIPYGSQHQPQFFSAGVRAFQEDPIRLVAEKIGEGSRVSRFARGAHIDNASNSGAPGDFG
jgi:hypothetical protein